MYHKIYFSFVFTKYTITKKMPTKNIDMYNLLVVKITVLFCNEILGFHINEIFMSEQINV